MASPNETLLGPEHQAGVLLKRAEDLIQRHGAPFVNPHFKERGVPGIWGTRTQPLPVTTRIEYADGKSLSYLNGLVYLAQQFPSLCTVLMQETINGENFVIHQFTPDRPFNSRLNEHLEIRAHYIDPKQTKRLLDYIEGSISPIEPS